MAEHFAPLIDDPEAVDIIVSSFARKLCRVSDPFEILRVPIGEAALRASLDGL